MALALAWLLGAVATVPPPAAPPAAVAPAFDLATLGQRGALAGERDWLGLKPQPCPRAAPGEIVVCARRDAESAKQRLPFPALRFEDGEIVRYAGEADPSIDEGHSCARPGSCEPSRLMQTLARAISGLYHAARNEDAPVPGYP